jgi:hypothetical protein
MLKQILATSALLAIVAVAVQPASAADRSKFRQLVVEPTGASADPIVLKKKKIQSLVAQSGNGIQTPAETADAGSGNGGGKKGAKFIVAPSQGIPTQTADAGNGNGGGKAVQFIVAPGQGLPTPTETGSKGKPKKIFPTLAKASGGIATPVKFADAGAEPIQTARTKTFPLIASAPEGLSTPAEITTADAQPADPRVARGQRPDRAAEHQRLLAVGFLPAVALAVIDADVEIAVPVRDVGVIRRARVRGTEESVTFDEGGALKPVAIDALLVIDEGRLVDAETHPRPVRHR